MQCYPHVLKEVGPTSLPSCNRRKKQERENEKKRNLCIQLPNTRRREVLDFDGRGEAERSPPHLKVDYPDDDHRLGAALKQPS